MAKLGKHTNELASYVIRHRAVCKSRDLKAEWESDITVSQREANAHLARFPDHDVDVVTEQTVKMRYTR
jgi:hypothetical protein